MNDQIKTTPAYRMALNAIALFMMEHPESNQDDYKIVYYHVSTTGEIVSAEVLPTDRYYWESLN